jgi:hypothetical protein
MVADDADPISASNRLLRESGRLPGPYDRPAPDGIRGALMSRSAPEVIYKVTETVAPAALPAPATTPFDTDGADAFYASCEALNVDPFFMDVICGAIGIADGEQDAKRERAVRSIRRQMNRLEARLAQLEGDQSKSAPVELPRLPGLRSVVA